MGASRGREVVVRGEIETVRDEISVIGARNDVVTEVQTDIVEEVVIDIGIEAAIGIEMTTAAIAEETETEMIAEIKTDADDEAVCCVLKILHRTRDNLTVRKTCALSLKIYECIVGCGILMRSCSFA